MLRRPALRLAALGVALGLGAAAAGAGSRTPLLPAGKLASWSRLGAWQAFAARGGGAWSVLVDARTGRPAVAWGRGIDVPGAGTGASAGEVEAAVRREILERHRELLGVDPAQLVLDEAASGSALHGRLWSLDFVPAPGGVRVEGARVGVRLREGRVVQLGTALLEDVAAPPPPEVSATEALRRAAAAAGVASPLRLGSERVLVPQLGDPARLTFVAAWLVRFRAPARLETWEARVDSRSGGVLWLQDANATACSAGWPRRGLVVGGILPESPADAELVRAFAGARVAMGAGAVVTDGSGAYPDDGSPSESSLQGERVATACDGCTSPEAARAQADAAGVIDFGTGGVDAAGNGASTRAERSAWWHVARARRLAAEVLDPATTPWLDAEVVAEVNLDATCTALWNGTRLQLSRAGGGCANAGEVAGLVAHEWAHGLVESTGALADRAHGEGFADLVAMLLWRREEIGIGWLPSGPVRCLDWRTCDDAPGPLGTPLSAAAVPAACPPGDGTPGGGEMHCEGQVLGQAGWDLVQELRAVHPDWGAWHAAERLVLAAMLSSDTYLPDDIGGAYWGFVLADDDDADLSNGTPHGGAIWRAFDLHGIAPAACGSHAGCLLPNSDSVACAPPGATPFASAATASPDDGLTRVELTWPADPAAATWNVYRSDLADHDAFALVASGLTSPGFTDETLLDGTTFWHAVQAVGPSGCASLDVTPRRIDVDLPRLRLVSATVSDAAFGDGDGVPEPGERLEILPRVAHAGGAGALTGVSAELVSPDASTATVARATVAFPDVLPGGEEDAVEPFLVDVAPGLAGCGARLPFTILLASGDCWRAGLELVIGAGAGDVAVSGIFLLDGAGNGNGRAEPGEAADLLLSLQALGAAGLTGGSVSVTSQDPLVDVTGVAALTDAPAGGTAAMTTALPLVVDPAHACPGEAPLIVTVSAAEGCWTREIALPIGRAAPVLEDGFETDLGWRFGEPGDDADRGAFTRGLPNAVTAGRSWQPGSEAGGWCALTGNETSPGDPEAGDLDGRTTMTSPVLDLTGERGAALSWRSWFATSQAGTGDLLRLLVRADGGPWVEAWREESDAPAWSAHALDLATILAPPLGRTELRFEAQGDPAHVVEAAVDDVRVAIESCDPPLPRAHLSLDSVAVLDGAGLGHGNGDGVPDPGESLVLVPTLVSDGNADALRVRVGLRLASGPPEAIAVGTTATAPDLAPRDLATTDDPHLRVRLQPDIACGAEVSVELTADFEDASGEPRFLRLGVVPLSVGRRTPAACDPFTDPACTLPVERIGSLADFEGPGDAGWSHGIERGAGVTAPSARDDWQRGVPQGLADDPPSAWEGARAFGTDLGIDAGDDGRHDASTRTFLQSPAWDASRFSHVRLRYARWLSVQGALHDVARVSVNGAEAWRSAGAGPLSDASCTDVAGLPSDYASDAQDMPEGPAGWKLAEHDVSAAADHAPSVVARWELQSDGRCERGGWSLDVVELVGVADEVACRPHAPCDASFLQVDGGPDGRLGCSGTAPLQARVIVADGPYGADVSWTPAAGVADPAALVTTTTAPGVYDVTITDRTTGCSRSDTVLVTDFRVPPIARASNDGPLTCARTSAGLSAAASGGDGSQGYAFEWSPATGVGDPFAAVTTATLAGTYTVTVTDVATGCSAVDSTTLARDGSPPIALAGPNLVSTCFGTVTLQGSASGGNGSLGYDVAWTPAAGLDDPTSLTPVTNVPGDYTLTVTDRANGCVGTDAVTVRDAGDRAPPVPVGETLRARRGAADVLLDVSLHAGAPAYRAYRSARASDVPGTGLGAGSAFLRLDLVPGPVLTDAGAAAPSEPALLFYRVQAVNSCGVEE